MTPFEIIILIIIYMICYGFVLVMFVKGENVRLRVFFLTIVSLALAFCVPLMIGGMLYEKLKGE